MTEILIYFFHIFFSYLILVRHQIYVDWATLLHKWIIPWSSWLRGILEIVLLTILSWSSFFRRCWSNISCGQSTIYFLGVHILLVITFERRNVKINVVLWFPFGSLRIFLSFCVICELLINCLRNRGLLEEWVHLLYTFDSLIFCMIRHKCTFLNLSDLSFLVIHNLGFLFDERLTVQSTEKLLLFARIIFKIWDTFL